MTRTLLVVPTGHGVGLTATCLGLVRALDQLGVDVGFVKPLSQRRSEGAGERSTALLRATSLLRPPEPVAVDVVERLLGEGAVDTLMEEALATAEPVIGAHDVVVVEGLVPSADLVYSSRLNLAMASALDADVVLVGAPADEDPERLAEAMSIAAVPYGRGERSRVAGAVVNRLTQDGTGRVEEYRTALAGRGLELVGAVPFRTALTWPRVGDLVAPLEAALLSDEGQLDRRVTDVVVAAQAVPGLVPLLTPGRLVIVPGDRHEIILSVCLAAMNGTRLAALLLTTTAVPDPRVWELCHPALATGLPVLHSPHRTYTVATRVHQLDPEIPADDGERARAVTATVAEHLDEDWVAGLPTPGRVTRLSPAAFRRRITALARRADASIVLPEGADPRTVHAAAICRDRGIARCVLLAAPDDVAATATGLGLSLDGIRVMDPADVGARHVDALVDARRHKGMLADAARDQLRDPITLGVVMLRLGDVDGLVAGAVHTTAATVRPALQVLGTKADAELVSSVFFMCLPDEVVVYGDCAINPDPDAGQLADIAIQSADSAEAFGIEPRVAMISFSTGTSGSGSDVDKVAAATRLVRERRPDLLVDGPLQYDAAAIASVARSKAPDSPVAGRATVFVFPDLNTGNTTYKAVQRSADVVSVGPMLQGLAKPVNDLSRGALVEDIVYTVALTAIQASRG